jgi:hypothetical protein
VKYASLLYLLLVPTVILVLHALGFYPPILHTAFGDPDYGYLLNSLRILEGMAPTHIDHPGTTLQVWGALVIRVIFFFHPTSLGLVDAVLSQPYSYLRGISYTLAVGLAGAVLCLGAALAARGNRWWLVVVAQVSPFLLPASSEMLAAENVTLDVEKHDRQRLNASIPPKTKGHQIGAQASKEAPP